MSIRYIKKTPNAKKTSKCSAAMSWIRARELIGIGM